MLVSKWKRNASAEIAKENQRALVGLPEVKLDLPKRGAFNKNVTIYINFLCALDVETTSVHPIAMQKLMAAPMITRVLGGDTYRRQIL